MRQLDQTLWCTTDHHGNTPLHIAAAHGNYVALQQGFFKKEIWLIEEGSEEGSEGGSEGGSKVVESDAEGSDIASGEGEIKVHDRSTCICISHTHTHTHIHTHTHNISYWDVSLVVHTCMYVTPPVVKFIVGCIYMYVCYDNDYYQ